MPQTKMLGGRGYYTRGCHSANLGAMLLGSTEFSETGWTWWVYKLLRGQMRTDSPILCPLRAIFIPDILYIAWNKIFLGSNCNHLEENRNIQYSTDWSLLG